MFWATGRLDRQSTANYGQPEPSVLVMILVGLLLDTKNGLKKAAYLYYMI